MRPRPGAIAAVDPGSEPADRIAVCDPALADAHAALAQYFRNEAAAVGTGLLAEHFLELVERHELASRNTASALLKGMLKYHIVRFVANDEGRRYTAGKSG